MSEDDILSEFGFGPGEKSRKGVSGKFVDMTGRKVGLYKCIGRHPERSKNNNESQWIVVCVQCGEERVARGSHFRAGLRCIACQGRPGNPRPANIVTDWPARLESLKREMASAIDSNDLAEIDRIGTRIARAARKVIESQGD